MALGFSTSLQEVFQHDPDKQALDIIIIICNKSVFRGSIHCTRHIINVLINIIYIN